MSSTGKDAWSYIHWLRQLPSLFDPLPNNYPDMSQRTDLEKSHFTPDKLGKSGTFIE
jgi:hypothetical protein